MNIVILRKFKKETTVNDLPNKLSKSALSSISISDEESKRS